MSTAGPARRFRDRLDRTLEFLLAVLMAGMALAVLWQIVTRLVLRDPSSTVEELVRFGLVWVGLLGAAYGFGRRAHLTIDLRSVHFPGDPVLHPRRPLNEPRRHRPTPDRSRARAIVGSLPGGLAYVNIVAGMLFGAISGSAAAAVAAVGGFMIPRMRDQGYDTSFSAAVSVSSATMSLVIPPSNILIVYSLASGGVSIAALFVAGYLPGILVGLLLMAVAGTIARRRAYPVDLRVRVAELGRRLVAALPGLFMIVIVIGGIVAGYFTATEGGAIAVLYSFVLAVIVYREVRLADVPRVLVDAATITSIVLLLVGTSMALSFVLAYERIPDAIQQWFIALGAGRVVTLLAINAILLVAGTVLDITPAVLIFAPMLLPIVEPLGVDPIHFGIIMVLNLCIGLCTPPVGSVLFLGCSVSGAPITAVSRALLPLYVVMIAALLLVTLLPEISLALPRWFRMV